MRPTRCQLSRLLEQQGRDERNDQGYSQQIERIAEGQDKGLLLHDTNRIATVARCNASTRSTTP